RANRRRHAARPQDGEVQRTSPSHSRAVQSSAGAADSLPRPRRLNVASLAGLWRRSAGHRALALHAFVLHGAVSVACRALSIQTVARALTQVYRPGTGHSDATDDVIRIVRGAARRWPGGSTCLTEALTARSLLTRRGCGASLRIGV